MFVSDPAQPTRVAPTTAGSCTVRFSYCRHEYWWDLMRDAVTLFEPVVDVRDVLESFLADRILVPNWRAGLTAASDRFVELGRTWNDDQVIDLGRRIGVLATGELAELTAFARAVARDLERLLDQTDVPGLPRRDTDDWYV